jgi:hypothetical protein
MSHEVLLCESVLYNTKWYPLANINPAATNKNNLWKLIKLYMMHHTSASILIAGGPPNLEIIIINHMKAV